MEKEKLIEQLMELLEIRKEMGMLGQQMDDAAEHFERLRVRVEKLENSLREH